MGARLDYHRKVDIMGGENVVQEQVNKDHSKQFYFLRRTTNIHICIYMSMERNFFLYTSCMR